VISYFDIVKVFRFKINLLPST